MDPNSDGKVADRGVLAVGVQSLGHATERTVRAGFEIAREVRGEITQRALAIIDGVEGMQQGVMRLARSIVHKADEVSSTWIEANERLALGLVGAAQTTGESATQLAAHTAAGLTSTRRDHAVGQA